MVWEGNINFNFTAVRGSPIPPGRYKLLAQTCVADGALPHMLCVCPKGIQFRCKKAKPIRPQLCTLVYFESRQKH